MSNVANPIGRQIEMFGSYEDKASATLRMLLEDCQEEMMYLFQGQCSHCTLLQTCCRLWLLKACKLRHSITPEEFVDFVWNFLKLKERARIEFKYKRVLCLR